MFVQVIEAKLKDQDLLERQLEQWRKDIKPGAKGYLGSTGGATADGRTIALVRFDSEAAARANSERPEQGAWFNEMQKAFDGPPAFTESSDTELLFDGGSNDAGFVQVMKGKAKDPAAFRKWGHEHEARLKEIRPDLIGGLDVWKPDGSFISVAYFKSEAEARKNEKAMAEDPMMAEYMSHMAGDMEFLDITNPDID
jgi:hypothetical protein